MGGDVAHGDRPLQAGREAAAGDPPDLIAFAVEDQCALANRLPPFDVEPDSLLRRALLDLLEDTGGAREIAFRAPPLADRKAEASHNGSRRAVDVMAIKRQPRLETQ